MRINVQIACCAAAAILALTFCVMPPISQDPAYHLFADSRSIADVPNFWNVISNLPFALVGLLGLWKLRDIAERTLFAGVLLTFFGSAYYHLAPSDARLVWDRLPMTLVFMSLLAMVLESGHAPWTSPSLLAALIACGATSVVWWRVTGDLRFYVLVQFGPLLILIPALWRVRDAGYLAAVLAVYGLAKLAEFYDRAIFGTLPLSGHSIKHLLAALATYFIFRWRLRVWQLDAAQSRPVAALPMAP